MISNRCVSPGSRVTILSSTVTAGSRRSGLSTRSETKPFARRWSGSPLLADDSSTLSTCDNAAGVHGGRSTPIQRRPRQPRQIPPPHHRRITTIHLIGSRSRIRIRRQHRLKPSPDTAPRPTPSAATPAPRRTTRSTPCVGPATGPGPTRARAARASSPGGVCDSADRRACRYGPASPARRQTAAGHKPVSTTGMIKARVDAGTAGPCVPRGQALRNLQAARYASDASRKRGKVLSAHGHASARLICVSLFSAPRLWL